jgi:elongator complex protein 5
MEESQKYALESSYCLTLGMNSEQFKVELVHSRRSGRAIVASYLLNVKTHEINYIVKSTATQEEDESLLTDLTSFNLSMTEKQRRDKENVELPYLQAQEVGQGGAQGGAIIYHFEKDDDYDEEDPYEDPF